MNSQPIVSSSVVVFLTGWCLLVSFARAQLSPSAALHHNVKYPSILNDLLSEYRNHEYRAYNNALKKRNLSPSASLQEQLNTIMSLIQKKDSNENMMDNTGDDKKRKRQLGPSAHLQQILDQYHSMFANQAKN